MWLYHRVMSPNDKDGMANSVDPDQTAPVGAVWSGSALFAQTYLSENLGSLRYSYNHVPWKLHWWTNRQTLLSIFIQIICYRIASLMRKCDAQKLKMKLWSSALFDQTGSISSIFRVSAYGCRNSSIGWSVHCHRWLDVTFSRSSSCAYLQKPQFFICIDTQTPNSGVELFCLCPQKWKQPCLFFSVHFSPVITLLIIIRFWL